MYLIALSPPPNIRRILSQSQTRIFQDLSSAAALTLPPIVPLGFYDKRPEPPAASALVQECQLRSTDLIRHGNHIYLNLSPAEEIDRIRHLLDEGTAEPLFPILPGVPIGIELEHPMDSVPWPAPAVAWKTCRLLCLELEIDSMPSWWENTSYVECWDIKLRRKL